MLFLKIDPATYDLRGNGHHEFPQRQPGRLCGAEEIARKALKRTIFEENPHWADASLAALVDQGKSSRTRAATIRSRSTKDSLHQGQVTTLPSSSQEIPFAGVVHFLLSRRELGSRRQVDVDDWRYCLWWEGVARLEDFVVFVPFVAPGEVVEAELTEVKKRFARARLLRVVAASPDRVEPLCPHFGQCGGCQYQHLDYSLQLRLKHKQISDLFSGLAGSTPVRFAPVFPATALRLQEPHHDPQPVG